MSWIVYSWITFLEKKLTKEGLVIVNGDFYIFAPSPDDQGVVDVIAKTLANVEGLLSGGPQLQCYPHL